MTDNRKRMIKDTLVMVAIRTGALVLLVLVVTAAVAILATSMGTHGQGGF